MTIKQFKQRFKRSREQIEAILDKIRDMAEEVDDEGLGYIVSDICDNVSIIFLENTDEVLSQRRLADYLEYLEELENGDREETEDEEDY